MFLFFAGITGKLTFEGGWGVREEGSFQMKVPFMVYLISRQV